MMILEVIDYLIKTVKKFQIEIEIENDRRTRAHQLSDFRHMSVYFLGQHLFTENLII